MKKTLFIAFAALAALVSCQKESFNAEPAAKGCRTITCTIENDTKVAIDAQGKVNWVVGDAIKLQDDTGALETVTLTAQNISADGKTATIKTTLSGSSLLAAYPASACSNTTADYGIQKFSNTNTILMAGYESEGALIFKNLCSIVKFDRPAGDYDSYIFCGNDDEEISFDSFTAAVLASSQNYKKETVAPKTSISGTLVDGENTIYIPGGNTLSKGFTISFQKSGSTKKIAKTATKVVLTRSKLLALGEITTHMQDAILNIKTAPELATFLSYAHAYASTDKVYIDNDIDISSQSISSCRSFAGTLDGQNHSIYGFNSNHKEHTFIKTNTGTVKNIVLGKSGDEATIVLGNFSTGSDCCILIKTNKGTVEGCVNYVSYGRKETSNFGATTSIFGFLVGTNKGTVKDCTNYGKIYIITTAGKVVKVTKTTKACKNYFGTIVGDNDAGEGYAGKVSGCKNYGGIYLPSGEGFPIQNESAATKAGYLYIGSICGRNGEGATIEGCTNEGVININAGVTATEGCDNVVRFGLIYGGGEGTASNCTVKGSLTINAYLDSTQDYYYGAVSGKDTPGSGNVYTECVINCTDNKGKGIRNPNE